MATGVELLSAAGIVGGAVVSAISMRHNWDNNAQFARISQCFIRQTQILDENLKATRDQIEQNNAYLKEHNQLERSSQQLALEERVSCAFTQMLHESLVEANHDLDLGIFGSAASRYREILEEIDRASTVQVSRITNLQLSVLNFRTGSIFYQLKRFPEALRYLEKAVEYNHDNLFAELQMAICLLQLGLTNGERQNHYLERAKKAFESVLNKLVGVQLIILDHIYTYHLLASGKWEEAFQALKMLPDLTESPNAADQIAAQQNIFIANLVPKEKDYFLLLASILATAEKKNHGQPIDPEMEQFTIKQIPDIITHQEGVYRFHPPFESAPFRFIRDDIELLYGLLGISYLLNSDDQKAQTCFKKMRELNIQTPLRVFHEEFGLVPLAHESKDRRVFGAKVLLQGAPTVPVNRDMALLLFQRAQQEGDAEATLFMGLYDPEALQEASFTRFVEHSDPIILQKALFARALIREKQGHILDAIKDFKQILALPISEDDRLLCLEMHVLAAIECFHLGIRCKNHSLPIEFPSPMFFSPQEAISGVALPEDFFESLYLEMQDLNGRCCSVLSPYLQAYLLCLHSQASFLLPQGFLDLQASLLHNTSPLAGAVRDQLNAIALFHGKKTIEANHLSSDAFFQQLANLYFQERPLDILLCRINLFHIHAKMGNHALAFNDLYSETLFSDLEKFPNYYVDTLRKLYESFLEMNKRPALDAQTIINYVDNNYVDNNGEYFKKMFFFATFLITNKETLDEWINTFDSVEENQRGWTLLKAARDYLDKTNGSFEDRISISDELLKRERNSVLLTLAPPPSFATAVDVVALLGAVDRSPFEEESFALLIFNVFNQFNALYLLSLYFSHAQDARSFSLKVDARRIFGDLERLIISLPSHYNFLENALSMMHSYQLAEESRYPEAISLYKAERESHPETLIPSSDAPPKDDLIYSTKLSAAHYREFFEFLLPELERASMPLSLKNELDGIDSNDPRKRNFIWRWAYRRTRPGLYKMDTDMSDSLKLLTERKKSEAIALYRDIIKNNCLTEIHESDEYNKVQESLINYSQDFKYFLIACYSPPLSEIEALPIITSSPLSSSQEDGYIMHSLRSYAMVWFGIGGPKIVHW